MKPAILAMTAILLLSSPVWAAAAKLPKAESEQLLKAAEKYLCTNPKIECGIFETIVEYKGYAMVMAAVRYAPELYVLLKKEGKVWQVVHAEPTAIMQEALERDKIPENILAPLISNFDETMYPE